jgi:hypothetical protein
MGYLIGEKSPAALFSDISFVAGRYARGKKRGFCRLPWRVATPGRSVPRAAAKIFAEVLERARDRERRHAPQST